MEWDVCHQHSPIVKDIMKASMDGWVVDGWVVGGRVGGVRWGGVGWVGGRAGGVRWGVVGLVGGGAGGWAGGCVYAGCCAMSGKAALRLPMRNAPEIH